MNLRITLFLAALWLAASGTLPAAVSYPDIVQKDKPAAYWRFNAGDGKKVVNVAPETSGFLPDGVPQGGVELQQEGPSPTLFPDFAADNAAAAFHGKSGFVRIKDASGNSPLRFGKGDTITLEAWVAPNPMKSGQQVYVIGKGRTQNKGFAANNQNYALRLREDGGETCVGFLFRDERNRPSSDPESEQDWHRWTSKLGFLSGSGWHHVVVIYTFGRSDSIKAYIDGQVSTGKWDMGGKSELGPVVDNDEVWIGSSMGGSTGSSFDGLLDEIAVYRHELTAQQVAKHYRFVAPRYEVNAKDLPADAVRVEIVENIGGKAQWNFVAPKPVETYEEPAFGFAQVPQKYTDSGVRADRSTPFMIRASVKVKLSAGEHRLLLRALQSARLYMDGQLLATTKFLSSRSDGHEEVAPIPTDLPAGLRFLRMGQDEAWLTVKSDGHEHVFVLEALVGGKNLRPEVGELSITEQTKDGRFYLLAPQAKIPHTDEGWTAYINSRLARFAEVDQQRRLNGSVAENNYWKSRHELARREVAKEPAVAVPAVSAAMPVNNEIDCFIGARLAVAKVQPAPLVDDWAFLRRVAFDTTGLPPTPELIATFQADKSPNRRAKAIDRFLQSPSWADHWVGYWQDVLAENPGILKPTLNNTGPFRFWIYESFLDNKPMDRFASELVMMEGSVYGGGPAGFELATQNDVPMADRAQIVSQAFLAMNLTCARCHDAPYQDFKQKDLFSLAAMLDRRPEEVPKTSIIPVNAKVKRRVQVTLKPGQMIDPVWPFAARGLGGTFPEGVIRKADDQREQFAASVTDPRNERFAQVIVNRLWKRYLGWGLVEPVEDWETAKPSHPELLSWLARELMTHDYDFKYVARLIMNSQTYQRVAGLNLPASDEPADRLFASPARRRLTAEEMVDSLFNVVGKQFDTEPLTLDNDMRRPSKDFMNFGVPTRAWQFTGFANDRDRPALALPKAQSIVDILQMFGWRDSRQSVRNERDDSANVLQPAALANGDMANARVARLSDDAAITDLCVQSQPLPALVDQVFLRILSRPPTADEKALFVKHLESGYAERVLPAPPKPLKKEYDPLLLVSWSNHLNAKATDIKLEMANKAHLGDPPTPRLRPEWRERMEDAVWALVNTPEFVFVP